MAKEGRDILQYTSTNTTVSEEFILKRMSSWQGHLKRISLYLVQGEGAWWEQTELNYEFYDSPCKDTPLPASPSLRETHFRTTTLNNIQERNVHMWDEITSNQSVGLPSPYVVLYDSQGNKTNKKIPNTEAWVDYETDIVPGNVLELEAEEENDTTHNTDILTSEDTTTYSVVTETETESTCKPTMETVEYKTKLAKAVGMVLPNSIHLTKLDTLRCQLKRTRSSEEKKEYYNALSIIKLKLEERYESLKKELKEFERTYYKNHNTLPSVYIPDYKNLISQRKRTLYLLNSEDFKL